MPLDNPKVPENIPGVDEELNLFQLTDLFHSYYKYHEDSAYQTYDEVTKIDSSGVHSTVKNLSRFKVLRRIEACRLGSRPYLSGAGIKPHMPNISLGYMRLLLDYLALPYKSIFRDGNLVKVKIDRKFFDNQKLSEEKQRQQKLENQETPDVLDNSEISNDVTDAYTECLRTAKETRRCFNDISLRVIQDGAIGILHPDIGWRPEPVHMIDLICEPFAKTDTCDWSAFFIIRKMSASEAVEKIRKPGNFWNADALRWALESSRDNRGILSHRHYQSIPSSADASEVAGENFSIKSFYNEKSSRISNIGGYWGNMLVVEGYFKNTKGKVTKVIFFPSQDVLHRDKRLSFKKLAEKDKQSLEDRGLDGADVLFYRELDKEMEDILTIIPFDRTESILERQRAFGHELFTPIDVLMRIDSCILNAVLLLSTGWIKNPNRGNNAEILEDLEIDIGNLVDIGEREFANNPYNADLNSLVAARQIFVQHVNIKAFLGGLDGTELQGGSGRGAQLANLRLVRDGRIHKHNIEDVSEGLTEFYIKTYRDILDMKDSVLDDNLVKKRFFDKLLKHQKHPENIFEYEEDDVIPDTKLPYWMRVHAVRNGGSHFGAAEVVLYEQIRNTFGDILSQQQLQAMGRMGIKSLLGSEDAIDILGDPKENLITSIDQVWIANLETGAILGSVDQGVLDYTNIPVRPDKDDHVTHLKESHMPKAMQIIEKLESGDVDPQAIQDLTEDELDTRTNLILKLGAIANHIQQHQTELERFGKARDDINALREEVNDVLQSAEALLNNLIDNIKALQSKRAEKELLLRQQSPEQIEERGKIEVELTKIASQEKIAERKLQVALEIDKGRKEHNRNQQLSKARDRAQKERENQRTTALAIRQQDIDIRSKQKEKSS